MREEHTARPVCVVVGVYGVVSCTRVGHRLLRGPSCRMSKRGSRPLGQRRQQEQESKQEYKTEQEQVVG